MMLAYYAAYYIADYAVDFRISKHCQFHGVISFLIKTYFYFIFRPLLFRIINLNSSIHILRNSVEYVII